MSRSRGRRKQAPPRKRRSWFSRLSPEVRIIGLVALAFAGVGLFLAWPREAAPPPEKLTVGVPADSAFALAVHEAQRAFSSAHPNLEVVVVDAGESKMRAYEEAWRKGESAVDLLLTGEEHLARWARAGLLASWDELVQESELRLAHVGLRGGRVDGAQMMLPLALELTTIQAEVAGGTPPPGSLDALADLARSLSGDRPALGANWQGQWGAAMLLATIRAAGSDEPLGAMLDRSAQALAWWRDGVAAGWARADASGAPLRWAGHRDWPKRSQVALWAPPRGREAGSVCVTYGALLPAKSEHLQAARLFAREALLSDDFQLALARSTGLVPASVEAWERLEGEGWKALTAVAARSIALAPELRSAQAAEAFSGAVRSCLAGELTPPAAQERLEEWWAQAVGGKG